MRIDTMYAYTKGLHTDEVRLRVSASKPLKKFEIIAVFYMSVLRYVYVG
jgi:hypothetical protein